MTALDLVRRIRANPKGSDFQDVRLVEEFVKQREQVIWGELRDLLSLSATDDDKGQVLHHLKKAKSK